jgi:hypothetical protein
LLEDRKTSERSICSFPDFCLANRKSIIWGDKNPSEEVLFAQKQNLEKHRETIDKLLARRDKYFAHLDKKYFFFPQQVFSDYPIIAKDVIALINCIIKIFGEHEHGLHPGKGAFHLSEVFVIGVDNMVRNLQTGRRINFPDA